MLAFGCAADMMKSVGSALKTSYSGKKWLKWFKTTGKAIIAELDGRSVTDTGVSTCAFRCSITMLFMRVV